MTCRRRGNSCGISSSMVSLLRWCTERSCHGVSDNVGALFATAHDSLQVRALISADHEHCSVAEFIMPAFHLGEFFRQTQQLTQLLRASWFTVQFTQLQLRFWSTSCRLPQVIHRQRPLWSALVPAPVVSCSAPDLVHLQLRSATGHRL